MHRARILGRSERSYREAAVAREGAARGGRRRQNASMLPRCHRSLFPGKEMEAAQ